MLEHDRIYRKLQKRLDQLPVGFPKTESGVEIRLLKYLFTPEEAQITELLSFLPETIQVIHKRVKKIIASPKDLEVILDGLAEKGAISRHISRKGIKVYSVTMLAVGIFEFQVDKLSKEFFIDFQTYIEEAFREELLKGNPQQLRPIPTEHSVMRDLPILPYDDIRTIITDFQGPILVANCVCKQGHDLLGHSCQVTDRREWCIILGGAAKNYHDLGWGRYIEKAEVFDILAEAEKAGLVVQPSNSKKPFCICLCCGCCCEVLTSAKPLENPVQYFNTNYEAVIDTDLCIGCGLCVKRCQMDALTVVNKKSKVDLTRCIGCGLCTTHCKPQAIRLQRRSVILEPAKNGAEMYMQMLRNRAGNAKMLIMLTKRLLGMKL